MSGLESTHFMNVVCARHGITWPKEVNRQTDFLWSNLKVNRFQNWNLGANMRQRTSYTSHIWCGTAVCIEYVLHENLHSFDSRIVALMFVVHTAFAWNQPYLPTFSFSLPIHSCCVTFNQYYIFKWIMQRQKQEPNGNYFICDIILISDNYIFFHSALFILFVCLLS